MDNIQRRIPFFGKISIKRRNIVPTTALYIPKVVSEIPTQIRQSKGSFDGNLSEFCKPNKEQEKNGNNYEPPNTNGSKITKPKRSHTSITLHMPSFYNLTTIHEVVE